MVVLVGWVMAGAFLCKQASYVLTVPLDQVVEGFAAMDARRAIKTFFLP